MICGGGEESRSVVPAAAFAPAFGRAEAPSARLFDAGTKSPGLSDQGLWGWVAAHPHLKSKI
jgi:hypothetical protein